jgi:mannitol/fructose-specific phosphotransferase system IIA component (Ntr-type)
MNLNDFLGPDPVNVELKAEDRWAAIDELMDHLIARQKIKPENRGAIVEAVKKRESSMSTGIGFGVGIPHATTDLVSDVVGAIGKSRNGINFESLDNQPVKFVVLFLVPKGQFQKHLNTLAHLAKLLHKKDFHDSL